jgi:nucleotide-binding universal stress UspA family protein
MFERILLLVDGTQASDRATHVCIDAAAALGSHVYALNVISPLPSVNLLADYIEGDICFTRVTGRATQLLERARIAGKAAGVDVSTEYTFDHRPDTVAVARAHTRGCDLVVMPGRGPGHANAFLRDVAQQVLLNGETPVLICP